MHERTDPKGLRAEGDATARRRVIVELVGEARIASQAELARLLAERGHRATQATLSRDLKALGIGKIPTNGKGYTYVLPRAGGSRAEVGEREGALELETVVQDVALVGNLCLIRTLTGTAHHVGRRLDELSWAEVKGTISGADTVLVVTDSDVGAQAFQGKLLELLGRDSA